MQYENKNSTATSRHNGYGGWNGEFREEVHQCFICHHDHTGSYLEHIDSLQVTYNHGNGDI